MAIRKKLAADFPNVPEYRKDLGENYNNLGILLKELGKRTEAEEQYRNAVAIQEKLIAEYPAEPAVVVQGDQVTFDAVTDAATPQTLDLASPLQPLTYDLYIDGQPAIGAVVFQSNGIRSTTDTMPFALYSSNSGLCKLEKRTDSPLTVSPPSLN